MEFAGDRRPNTRGFVRGAATSGHAKCRGDDWVIGCVLNYGDGKVAIQSGRSTGWPACHVPATGRKLAEGNRVERREADLRLRHSAAFVNSARCRVMTLLFLNGNQVPVRRTAKCHQESPGWLKPARDASVVSISLSNATAVTGSGPNGCRLDAALVLTFSLNTGATAAGRFPLHLISNQPSTRLHRQLDHAKLSSESKVAGVSRS